VLPFDPNYQKRIINEIQIFKEDGVSHNDISQFEFPVVIDEECALLFHEIDIFEGNFFELVDHFLSDVDLSIVATAFHVVSTDNLIVGAI
jgi:hypothetical protein